MKSKLTIQLLHDRLVPIVMGEIPLVMPAKDHEALHLALDVLCYVLEHDHNQAFALNMARLQRDLHAQHRYVAVDEPLRPTEARALFDAGERFVMVKDPGDVGVVAGVQCLSGIQCLACAMTSWNDNDRQNLYCGKCHVFHDEELKKRLNELEAWAEQNGRQIQTEGT